MRSAGIADFVDAAAKKRLELHSLMLVRHGCVAAEAWWAPYGPEHPHTLFSLSKSFTSTAVGLAVAEGRLTVEDPVIEFFPEHAPKKVSANLAAMRVRHLLTMNTGHEKDTTGALWRHVDCSWARTFLQRPVEHAPGTKFVYNSGATYMLSAIVQKLTGQPLLQYLTPRLFEPLGITGATWESCPEGINAGGWGLSIKTEDIARFGQMYLQGGVWQGRQIVPAAWVAEATAKQTSNGDKPDSDWEQGYGYQFWRCRHNGYRGDGAFGQFCVVLPEQDTVLAMTAGLMDMQVVLNLVWEHLLPAMTAASLPEDRSAQVALNEKLAGLAIAPPAGAPTAPDAAEASGQWYPFPENPQKVKAVRLDFGPDAAVLAVRDGQGEHRLTCGYGEWVWGETTLDAWDGQPRKVAAAGAWTDANTFTVRPCFYETAFTPTITCKFADHTLSYRFRANAAFGPRTRPELVGHAEGQPVH